MTLTVREKTTILAALRYWQDSVNDDQRASAMPLHFEDAEPLTENEINALCDKLNR